VAWGGKYQECSPEVLCVTVSFTRKGFFFLNYLPFIKFFFIILSLEVIMWWCIRKMKKKMIYYEGMVLAKSELLQYANEIKGMHTHMLLTPLLSWSVRDCCRMLFLASSFKVRVTSVVTRRFGVDRTLSANGSVPGPGVFSCGLFALFWWTLVISQKRSTRVSISCCLRILKWHFVLVYDT